MARCALRHSVQEPHTKARPVCLHLSPKQMTITPLAQLYCEINNKEHLLQIESNLTVNMTTSFADKDSAINLNLVRYVIQEDPTDKTPQQVYLQARERLKPRKKTTLAEFLESDDPPTIPPYEPTDKERSVEDVKTEAVYLWVGMRPTGAEDFTRSKLKGHCRAKSVETSKMVKNKQIAYDPNALRVVTPYSDADAVNFFVLLNPDEDGVCDAIECVQEEVFYFSQYREGKTTDIEQRKKAWRRLILATWNDATREKVAWPRTYDKTRFDIPAPKSRLQELIAFTSTYLRNPGKNGALMKRCLDLLKEEGQEIVQGNERLYQLANEPGELSLDDCVELKNQIEVRVATSTRYAFILCGTPTDFLQGTWPDLEEMNMTPEELHQLCQALEDKEKTLLYVHIRAFLVAFVTRLRDSGACKTEDLAESTMKLVELQIGTTLPKAVSVTDGPICALLTSIADSLEDLGGMVAAQTSAIADSQGNHSIADHLPQIFEKYGATFDLDQSKLLVSHLTRFVAAKVVPALEENTVKGIEERVAMIRKLVKALQNN